MSRNKKKTLPVIENLVITDYAAEGNSLARIDEMVVFIPYGAPGDVADVQLTRKRKSYAEGRITALRQPSPVRVEPRCAHFTVCGGCKWQHVPYSEQLAFKQRQVEETLRRIAKVELPVVSTILGCESPWFYRNKMEYTFSNRKWLTREQMESDTVFEDRSGVGFHIPGAFDKVLDIDACMLQDPLGDEIRNFVRQYARDNKLSFYDLRANEGLLRTLMIRIASTGDVMVFMAFGADEPSGYEPLLDALHVRFPPITSLVYAVNLKANDSMEGLEIKTWAGKDHIEEEMEGLRFRVGAKSFYQTNSRQAYRLYSVVREMAALKGDELVYDLYTGTGTIANFVARGCRHVVGIEYVEDAIKDARVNSAVNSIDNTEFHAGDMKDVLTADFVAAHGRPDVMIVDPPRAGMHEDVVNVILGAAPDVIVYVSCNPATQARDLQLLDGMYRVEKVQPVDMFPHTHHVENVVKLVKR